MAIRGSTSLAAVAVGTTLPLNVEKDWPTTIQVTGTFVGTYNVEYTTDLLDAATTAVWAAAPNGSALTAGATVKLDFPASACRLNCTAYTSGTIVMKMLQGQGS